MAAEDEDQDQQLIRLTEVTEASHEGWRSFVDRHGSSLKSFAEVVGLALADIDAPLDDLPEPLRQWVIEARALTARKRRRR